jgi:hypothetical protein
VDSSSGKSEFQSGNHNEVGPRKRLAMLNVPMHSDVVEHFGMIGHGGKRHARLAKDFDQTIESFVAIRVDAVHM